MKQSILLLSVLFVTVFANAQIQVYVEAPSPNEGSYEFTYANGGNWSAIPDLSNPANAVLDTMVMVNDGTVGDSLACSSPFTNAADIDGQVAVLYRGSCEFGLKALNAQNAGAVAVIIINNTGGAPLEMGAGASGGTVNIPVVMITQDAGALLKAEIEAGNTKVFIGSKNGFYGDDLSIRRNETLRAQSFGVVQDLAQNGTEFNFAVGAWVRNYGSNDQNNVQLNCTVDLGGSNLYDETSATMTILAGDSAWVPLPDFSQSTYANGLYEMTYSIIMTTTDESDYDNSWDANFLVNDSLFSTGTIDEVALEPVRTYAQFNGEDGDGTYTIECLHFKDPNASRMGFFGMTISTSTSQNPDPTSLDGAFIETFAYEWNDVFDSLNDLVFPDDFYSLTLGDPPLASGEHLYISDDQTQNIFIPFDNTPLMQDDQRYLFCLYTDAGIYPGFDNTVDFSLNPALYDQPVSMVHSQDQNGDYLWFPGGHGGDKQPAMTVHFYSSDQVGIMEQTYEEPIQAFPNPATEFVTVLLGEDYGDVIATIMNLNGQVVSTQNVSMEENTMQLDVTTLATGTYLVDLMHSGDQHTVFKVTVTRK